MGAIWQNSLNVATRVIINDLEGEDFTDEYINKAIVLGGLFTTREFSFDTSYSFNLVTNDISPDPAAESTFDPLAVTLFVLKAACIINSAQMQDRACNSIRVQDGESEIDLSSGSQLFRAVMDTGPCQTYKELLLEAKRNKTATIGFMITTPISHFDLVNHPFETVSDIFDHIRH